MSQPSLQELLDEYMFQRKQNVQADQALKLIAKLRPDMPEIDRQQLASLIKQWELGKQNPTTVRAHSSSSSATAPVPPPSGSGSTSKRETVTCLHCQAMNPADIKFCYVCHEKLSVVSSPPVSAAEVQSAKTGHLGEEAEDPALFGTLSTLLIAVRNYEQHPLHINLADQPLAIGRSDPNSNETPDIDFQPYGASEMGVSRQHAILRRTQQTITVVDQGSVNHTYINGEKVHAHEVRVIRDGDEVRFGRLITHFTFKREMRRLS